MAVPLPSQEAVSIASAQLSLPMQTEPNQPELAFDSVLLPDVEVNIRIPKVGFIRGILEPARTFTPTSQEEIPNRRSRAARIIRDRNGKQLLITTTRSDRTHPNQSEILLTDDQCLTWLRHGMAEAMSARLTQGNRPAPRDEIRISWSGAFQYRDATLSVDGKGLRPPQIGALHAILSHWTLSAEPVTVVMPTGTGKTETMLSLLITAQPECMLVVVPSKALRDQTARKFATLGILPLHDLLHGSAKRPLVGILEHQVGSEDALELFDRCNVVVAVIDSIAMGKAREFLGQIAQRCSHLVLDEAHHVAASSWTELKKAFAEKPVVQFTATPFREDRSALGGKQIYNYPLRRAQDDGYFKPIRFKGVFEVDQATSDRRIAEEAVAQLRSDLHEGLNHRLLARCRTQVRAENVLEIYQELAPDLSPVLIHSGEPGVSDRIARLRSGEHSIVVTVNMLAEGFDMPELKVAAMHDIFKSLAITLQFTGRFPRVGGESVGLPTIIANTGFVSVANSLQALYDEDPDWNDLLANLSFERIEEERKFDEFLRNARDLGGVEVPEDSIAAKLTPQSLIPRYNAIVYRAETFNAHGIPKGLDSGHRFVRGWSNPPLTFFITRLVDQPKWTKSRGVEDSIWNLTALYHDAERRLLYVGTSFSSATNHQSLANAVTGIEAQRLQGEVPFRIFDGVQRLILQQVGLLSTGSRNHRYSMFAGADVKDAISRVILGNAQKSNIFGTGFRDGGPVGFGCSKKGKIWGREFGSLTGWREWCDELGTRLLNEDFDTTLLIENALVAERQTTLPDKTPWYIDWPEKLMPRKEGAFGFTENGHERPFHQWEISILEYDRPGNSIRFRVSHDSIQALQEDFQLTLDPEAPHGHNLSRIGGADLSLRIGREMTALERFFDDYVPLVTFTDQSVLEGCELLTPRDQPADFPLGQANAMAWPGVDIRKESFLKDGNFRADSIQAFAIQKCRDDGFQIIFDDDGSNEIADLVAIRDLGNQLTIRLVHCKYSAGADAGGRIKDVTEVTSQAVKNIPWFWNMERLAKRMALRDRDRSARGFRRFLAGSPELMSKVLRLTELSAQPIREVIVVQPGLSKAAITPQITSVLGSADSYLRMAAGCHLAVWCSP